MRVLHALDARVGGAASRHAIVVFALTLGLGSADMASIGAVAPELKADLHIGNGELGLLAAVSTVAGALATLPVGTLVDRVCRTRLLSIASLTWAAATIASALAWSYPILLTTRVVLGVLTAAAGPGIASLLGDSFPAKERARIYGLVLAGELVGTGFGFVVSGDLAGVSWRAAFGVLAVPALGIAWLWRQLPEPERGAGGDDDPANLPLWTVVRYMLRIKTNLILIVAGAAGYFFFAGVKTFAVTYAREQYGLGQSAATNLVVLLAAGALGGVLNGGRITDRLAERGIVSARPLVAAIAVSLAAVLFVPALLTSTLLVAMPLLFMAAWMLGTLNPPADAARLDILHPRMWGRGDGVRSVLRVGAEAIAPLLFGVLSDTLSGGGQAGLRDAFLITLIPLFAASGLAFLAVRTYPSDVETAVAAAHELTGPAGRR
jgi:predicted MFS family arabinose efflux permease